TSPGIQNNYISTVPTGFAVNNYTVKVDYALNDEHRLSGHLSPGKRHQTTLYRNGYMPLPYTPTRQVVEVMTTSDIKETWLISRRLLNEFSIGFTRFNVPIQDTTMLPNCGEAGAGRRRSWGKLRQVDDGGRHRRSAARGSRPVLPVP